ncbi:serine hydrolase [Rhizocola hellebori]|nr:serine hydrolase [Rhizocola hellebori]
MSYEVTRRAALGVGAAAAATFAFGSPAGATETDKNPVNHIRKKYSKLTAEAGGRWHSHIAMVNGEGALETVLEDDADFVTNGYSVQKLFVAMTVLDKVDRGLLTMGQRLDLQASIILGGSGIYHLHGVWGDDITIANFLTAMLLVSDNTSVRMCGRVVPALEINEILAAKGFVKTRVEPVANPNRFFLGVTTPRETHDFLWRLANGTLLSPASTDFLLRVTRWVNGYHDGIRRSMSSNERSRVATKYGADFNTLGAARNEAGIMFNTDGSPALTYAMFADSLGDLDNYGSTHPAVEVHAKLGRVMFDSLPAPVAGLAARSFRHTVPQFVPVNGG